MGILLKRRSWAPDDDRWYQAAGWISQAGLEVTETTALNVMTVASCVKVLSETVAQVPLISYRRLARGKERALKHPLYSVLHDRANPLMTSFQFRLTLTSHVARWGNGYAWIERDKVDRVKALWPLAPDRMTPKLDNSGAFVYEYNPHRGGKITYQPSDIFHVYGLGYGGLVGYSPIAIMRDAIGLAKAMEQFGSKFFKQGAKPSAVLSHPDSLGPETRESIEKSLQQQWGGLDNHHKLIVLEEGMQLLEVGMPADDVKFLASRKFQRAEIAGWYRVPLHMIQDLERSTNNNIEHMGIEFGVYSMGPWFVNWEQAIALRLFEDDAPEYFAEFKSDGLMRGDAKSEAEAMWSRFQMGAMSPNDIREIKNENPVEGGDQLFVPLNMVPLNRPIPPSTDGETKTRSLPMETRSAEYRRRLAVSYQRVFEDAVARILRRERADVMRQAEKDLAKRSASDLSTWMEAFYESHQEFIRQNMAAPTEAFAEAIRVAAVEELGAEVAASEISEFLDEYMAAYAKRHAYSSLGQLRQVLDENPDEPLDALATRFDEWEEKRPGKVARWETVRLNGAVAREVFRAGGVTKLRWVTHGPNCPICNNLSGKVVGIEEKFASKGDRLHMGNDKWMRLSGDHFHPPLHSSCDCSLVAES